MTIPGASASIASGGKSRSPVARHIAQAAARLFATHGYDATSVRMIVEAAGVTKPTLYYHFGSKEGLAHALLTEPLTELNVTLRDLIDSTDDAVDLLIQIFLAHFKFCRDDPDRMRFLYALYFGPASTSRSEECCRLGEALTATVHSAAARLADEGLIGRERVASFAKGCQAMIIVSTLDYLYKNIDFGPDLAPQLVQDLLDGFGTRRPQALSEEGSR